jgi:hypothetical protein
VQTGRLLHQQQPITPHTTTHRTLHLNITITFLLIHLLLLLLLLLLLQAAARLALKLRAGRAEAGDRPRPPAVNHFVIRPRRKLVHVASVAHRRVIAADVLPQLLLLAVLVLVDMHVPPPLLLLLLAVQVSLCRQPCCRCIIHPSLEQRGHHLLL